MEQETVSAPGNSGKEERMGNSRIATVLAAAMVVALVCGCAIVGKGPTDEELVAGTVADYNAALLAQDVEKILATISDDFEGQDGATKDQLGEFFEMAVDQGFLDDVEVNDEDCEIVIEGDTATAGPIEYNSAMGSLMMELTLKKDADGGWRIVDMAQF
jgi:ketosteroid isomerase-like protein